MHRRHFLRELGPVRPSLEQRRVAPDLVASLQRELGALTPVVLRHLRPRPAYIVECYAGHLAIHLPGEITDALAARMEAAMHEYLQARSLCLGVWESARARSAPTIRRGRLVERYRIDRFGIAIAAEDWDASCSQPALEDAIAGVVYAGILNGCLWDGWRVADLPKASDLGIVVMDYTAELEPRPHDPGTFKRVFKRAAVDMLASVGGILCCGVGLERGFGLLYKGP